MLPVTETPVAGYYQTTLVKDGPWVPVRIWFGQPLDPDFPRLVDRAPRWQCCVLGRLDNVDRYWPWCGKHPIGRARYRYLLASYHYAIRFDAREPLANPYAPVDLMRQPVLF